MICVAPLANEAAQPDLGIGSIHLTEVPPGVWIAAFVALWLLLAVVLLAIVGAIWLRTAAAEHPIEQPDEAEERARLTILVVGALLVSIAVLPVAWGVFVAAVMLIVILARSLGPPEHLTMRILLLSLAVALGLMGYQAHSPQRFDLLELSGADAEAVTGGHSLRVALIAVDGDAYVVAACDRLPFEVLGQQRWAASRPIMMRLPIADTGSAQIVRGEYTFLQQSEPSVLGAFLALVDLAGLRTFTSANLYGTFGEDTAHDVCGGVDDSAATAGRFARALTR